MNPADQRRAERIAAQAQVLAVIAEADRAKAELEKRLTVQALFDHWKRVSLTPQTLADGSRTGRKDGGEYVEQAFKRRVFPKLGHIAVEDVRRADLMSILDETKAAGRVRVANMLLTDLSQMFRFAVQREIVQRNPLEGIRRADVGGREPERERALSEAEIRLLGNAIPAARMAPRSARAIWLILSTGARVGEAMGAVWADQRRTVEVQRVLMQAAAEEGVKYGVVDVAARTWHLPDTKNGRSHTIHLSDFAVLQFRALLDLGEVDKAGKPVPWVFPSRSLAHPVCVKSVSVQSAHLDSSERQRMLFST